MAAMANAMMEITGFMQTEQVISQICLSPRVGVISQQLPTGNKIVLFISGRFTQERVLCKENSTNAFILLASECLRIEGQHASMQHVYGKRLM